MMYLEQNNALLSSVRSLTLIQRRILFLLTLGYQNKVIGGALGISEPAVKSHMTRILEALSSTNRTQAALVGFCLLNQIGVDGIVGRRRMLTDKQVPTEQELDLYFVGERCASDQGKPAQRRDVDVPGRRVLEASVR